ncbi:LPXTG cell wall anchor domain-containing protein [Staphylococcus sp. HKU1]
MHQSESAQNTVGNTNIDKEHNISVKLPDTGKDSNERNGLIGAALTMLAGLGLLRRSKKNKKNQHR